MASVNKVILIGNLGADPEIKYTQGNVPVANLRVATSERWQDKSTSEWKEKTEWHRVVAWRHLAERAERYLAKGKQVYVEGRLETRQWQDRDGNTRYTTEVRADQLMILGRREDSDGGERHGGRGPRAAESPETFDVPPLEAAGPVEDDDLPF